MTVAARMYVAAKPWANAFVLCDRSLDPTSTAMTASACCAAIATGRLSIVPPSMHLGDRRRSGSPSALRGRRHSPSWQCPAAAEAAGVAVLAEEERLIPSWNQVAGTGFSARVLGGMEVAWSCRRRRSLLRWRTPGFMSTSASQGRGLAMTPIATCAPLHDSLAQAACSADEARRHGIANPSSLFHHAAKAMRPASSVLSVTCIPDGRGASDGERFLDEADAAVTGISGLQWRAMLTMRWFGGCTLQPTEGPSARQCRRRRSTIAGAWFNGPRCADEHHDDDVNGFLITL